MLKTAPDPVDVQDLQFKLRCRLKIFDNVEVTNFAQPCGLIACASRFGLIFVGTNSSSFQVIQLKQIEELTKGDGDKADYPRRIIPVASPPKYLSVNCEHTILSVVIEQNGPVALFYDVKSFWQQNVVQLAEVRLSATLGVYITEVNWNPALAATFTACKSDGTLGIYEVKNPGIDINELPVAAGATCFCWSPKGKQIAVGSRDGKITQYKPDLKAVKVINAPPLKEPHSLISLQWVSNYQFIGVFQPVNPDSQPCLIVIDAPKTGDSTYMNYDDICYSNGNARQSQFYMILQQHWNILMVASSNSMEVGILGNSGERWSQWIMGDAARAELPLSVKHQETLPIGFGLDIGNTQALQWGETTLPPVPILLLLSHHGTLCCFNVVNLKEGAPTICTPPDPVKDASGVQHFVAKIEVPKVAAKEQVVPPPVQPTVELPKVVQPKTPKSNSTVFEIQSVSTNKQPGLSFSTTQASTLFGGQATLIPVGQGSKSSPSLSQSLYPTLPYQTLYPSLPSGETSTVQIPASISISTPTTPKTQVATPPQSATILSIPQPPKVTQTKTTEEVSKIDISIDQKAEEEAEILFSQMVREECVFLESELKAVLHQGRSLKLNLGTDADKTKIVQFTQSIQDFFKELDDICTTQKSEVHILKQNLLQSWAWFEEVKSRYLASNDASMVILLQAQPLDSASEKQLEDIRHANYYLESQVAQAHRALDEQWENFQDYCKKTHKMQMPTMEMIFQTMVKQNAILRKQSYVLKDIASRIKGKSRSALGPSLLLSVNNITDLPDELKRLRMDPEDICQIQYEHVVNRTKNFTKKKSDSLRCFLKKREYPHVSAVKPLLSTTILQASPSTKLKSLISSLNASTTTIFKENVGIKPNFVQSTPKPVVRLQNPTDLQAGTPIEGLQNFALKFEAKNFNQLPEKNFTPLTKGMIASSPNSAFVSTSFGSTVSTSTPTSSSFKPVIFGTPVTTAPTVKIPVNFQIGTLASSTTQPVTNASKQFSFASTSAPSVFVQEITNTSVTKPFVVGATTITSVGNMAKPTFSFNLPTGAVPKTVTTVATPIIFGKTDVKTVTTKPATSTFNVIVSKPSSVATPALNLTITKPAADVPGSTAAKTTIFGSSTATATPAFALGTSSIFGNGSETPSATPTKPFVFSSTTPKTSTITAVTTGQNRFVLSTSNASTTAGLSLSFVTPTTSDTGVKDTQPSAVASSASKTVTQPVSSTVSSQSIIFGSAQTTPKPSLLGVFATSTTTQSSIFSSTTTTSTQPSILAAAVSKPSIFSTAVVSQPVSTAATTASTISTAIAATTTTAATTSSSNLSVVFGTSASSQPIFGSAVSTTTVQSSTFTPVNSTSTIGLSTTPSTKPSIFGTTPSTTKTPIFGTSAASTVIEASPASQTIGFGAKTTSSTSIFGTAVTTTTQPSLFGNPPTSTTSQSEGFALFGDTAQKSPVFGSIAPATNTATQSSIFGSNTQTSIFGGITTTATAIFGGTTTTATPIFGGTTTTAAPIFGGTTSAATPIFGATTTAATPIFGGTTTTATPIFGATTTTATPIFGATTTTATPIFGGTATTATPIFGAATTTTATPIFGGAATTATPIFGATTTAATPIFGGTTTTTSPAFGQSQSLFEAAKSTPSVFGQSSAFGSSAFGGTSVFGAPATSFGQSSGSIFGSAATTTSGSIFGGTPTATSAFGSSPSVFGAPVSSTSSVFGSGSVFSSAATQPSSFTSNASATSFGFGGLSVGSTPTTASSGFGAAPSSNPFGGENKSVFGSTATATNSVFGSSGSSIFGSPSQGFGSGFGSQTAFAPSTFGGSFGQQSAGPFSGGSSGSVAQSGFSAGATFQKPGFGGSPVFGSNPAFGSPPSFGGAPAFGGSPTFGSSSKVFGGGSTGFGASNNAQNTGFGNLANQPTLGFGNLAQQAANSPTTNAPFSGNSSFSSWR